MGGTAHRSHGYTGCSDKHINRGDKRVLAGQAIRQARQAGACKRLLQSNRCILIANHFPKLPETVEVLRGGQSRVMWLHELRRVSEKLKR